MVYYDSKPSVFEAVGDNSTRYHWDITSEQVPAQEGQETREQWKCEEVIVFAPLSANKFVKAVIDEKWGNGYEEKLINEYNSAQMGLIDGEEAAQAIARYRQFLIDRAALKAQVEEDYAEYMA